jgi:AcrR family transcriptional regulator
MSDTLRRVERACRDLAAEHSPITFDAVAARAGIGRATLYRRPELRAIVEEHRQTLREALTLTGLNTQIDQLRATLDALAGKVRRQEERLRLLEHRRRT